MDSFAWNRAFSLLSSARLANDLMLTANGLKPCCRLTLNRYRLSDFGSFLESLNLVYASPRFSKLAIPSGQRRTYSSSSSSNCKDAVEYATIFVSRHQDVSFRALNASDLHNDHDLGQLLGYPDCCTSRFVALRALAEQNNMSLLPHIDGGATRFDALLNVFGWFLDVGVTSHFPCSLTCGQSSAFARKSLEILDHIVPRQALVLVEQLSAEVGRTDYGFTYVGLKTGEKYVLNNCGEELPARSRSLTKNIDRKREVPDRGLSGEESRTFKFN
ncbi:hypothetical protein [Pseudophaeobacter arcticus]|jgi:hypothetical protein|uniref:hypothetical protein n=1 Tax=Pseudophaeobacter arcticus TaxID=385492 RepID=UPI00333F82B5